MVADAIGLDGRLAEVLDSIADGVTVLDRRGKIRFANDAAAELMAQPDASSLMGRNATEITDAYELLDADGGTMDLSRSPTRRAFAGERDPEELMRFRVRGTLQDRWSLVRARLLRGAVPDDDLVVTAFQDITSLKRSEDRLRFLSEASAILAQSVDYQETVARIARIAVPRLADWCTVDVIERGEGLSRLAVAHADPAKVALAEEIRRRWPPDPETPTAVHQVLESRQSRLMPVITDVQLVEAARDGEHLAILRDLGISSALVVPLEARGEALGVLSLVQAESGRSIDPEDVSLAEELGRRAGAAIDAARLVSEAQETARVRDEFIAVASHDMRTPLAAVRGYAQLARRQLAQEQPELSKVGRWLGEIETVVGRLNSLVSEFMDASLLHGGEEVPLEEHETDLGHRGGGGQPA
ncbi:MAG TPA: histidine kinase dimerization/phospho-acceptor domain-containing protein [Candidatus Limnocylindrales bacterium]|nr:histidine kinase dimerization/phospho-acceptor domain-containing protein [Candidatus Limnocylindrales bacterium]